MRWPLRKKPSGAPEPRPESARAGHAAPADPVVAAPHTPAPEREPGAVHAGSQPRADWAHVGPLKPVVSSPPVTFDGARFGRSVSGARPLTPQHRVYSPRSAPSGVMRDVVTVEGVLPHVADADDVHAAATPGGVLPATPGIVHRKSSAGRARVQRLTSSDFEASFPTTELFSPPPAPIAWTPEDGFVETQQEEDGASGMRVVRRRAVAQPASALPADAVEDVEFEEEEEEVEGEPEIRRPAVRFVPIPGPRLVGPPQDLVDIIEQVTGVHVGDTVIDRSPAVTERAAEMGAIAFTEHGTVHLPSELGPLDDPGVRSVTAHELVHVAQHRIREGDIPPEDSVEGRELEAQARQVQRSVAPGAPVVPTFLRSEINRPVRRNEGPVGVQRLISQVSEYEGDDYSEIDFSLVEPRSSEDKFAWQERDGEPTDVPWSERQEWADKFEDDHGARLQRARDDYFNTLVQQAGPNLTERGLPGLRQRLDAQMPYQFGSPFGIDPYPDVELPEGGGVGGVAGGVTAGVGGRSRRAPVTPPSPLEQAEGDASRSELHAMTLDARANAPAPGGEFLTYAELLDRLNQRRDRERDMRKELLHAKRDAAEEQHAPAGHVVALTQDEIDEIRGLVDIELPADAIDYLEQDDHASITMAGAFGAFVAAQTTAPLTHRRNGTPPTGGRSTEESTNRTNTTNAPGGGGENETEEDRNTRAGRLLTELQDTRFVAPVGDFELTFDDMVRLLTARSDREGALRRELLGAKMSDAGDLSLLPDDFVFCLTREELDAVRHAVDAGWPKVVGMDPYLADNEFASLSLDGGWGAFVDEPESLQDAIARKERQQGGVAVTTTTAPTTASTSAGSTQLPAVQTNGDAGSQARAMALTNAPAAGSAAPGAGSTAGDDGVGLPAVQAGAGVDEDEVNVVEGLSEYELDRLTRRMWTRIRRELRSELLIDRERAGVLADMR